MVIKTTILVGHMESVRKEYGSKDVIFVPEFLCKSKANYGNGYPSKKLRKTWLLGVSNALLLGLKDRCRYIEWGQFALVLDHKDKWMYIELWKIVLSPGLKDRHIVKEQCFLYCYPTKRIDVDTWGAGFRWL